MTPLAAAYLAAQDQLNAIYRDAVAGQGQGNRSRTAYLAFLLAAALAVVDALDAAAHDYATQQIAESFAAGAVHVDPEWQWSDTEVNIAHALAADSYADLIAANNDVRAAAKRLFRELRDANVDVETRIGALTAAEYASGAGFARVLYRNGARFPLAAYASMAVNTKLAVAFNAGALNAAAGLGAAYIEVRDGPECGWSTHRDPDKADGTVRAIEDFAAFPIAHPNCVRTPGAVRLDVTTPQEAADATPFTPDAPPVDQPVPAVAASPVRRAGRSSRTSRAGAAAAAVAGATAMSQRRASRQFARLRRTQR